MNSTFFGSFSKVTFFDLFELNYRSYYNTILIVEVLDKEIVSFYENISDLNDVRKKYNSSYLLCFMSENEESIYHDMSNNTITLLETHKNMSFDKCIEKHKPLLYVVLKNNLISILYKNHGKYYCDDFQSISYNPFNGFMEKDADRISYVKLINTKKD